jgi:hypothetical protein
VSPPDWAIIRTTGERSEIRTVSLSGKLRMIGGGAHLRVGEHPRAQLVEVEPHERRVRGDRERPGQPVLVEDAVGDEDEAADAVAFAASGIASVFSGRPPPSPMRPSPRAR